MFKEHHECAAVLSHFLCPSNHLFDGYIISVCAWALNFLQQVFSPPQLHLNVTKSSVTLFKAKSF